MIRLGPFYRPSATAARRQQISGETSEIGSTALAVVMAHANESVYASNRKVYKHP